MISISYAITACNEHVELSELINRLTKHITVDDEIVIVLDEQSTTKEVEDLCRKYSVLNNLYVYTHSLNKDFAAHKNYLNSKCTKDWIFNIDADEYPSEQLILSIKDILSLNEEVDIIAVPRVNKVIGLTNDYITKWGWNVDHLERVNWPDYQMRLYKNTKQITWQGKVHERPIGWKVGSHLPNDVDDYALIHIKGIDRQVKQNDFYSNII